MKSKRTDGDKKRNRMCAVAIGTAFAIVVCVIASILEPYLILNGTVSQSSVATISIINQAIGAFLGATIASVLTYDKKWFSISISVGLFYVLLACFGILFFENDPKELLAGFLGCAIGGASALLLLFRGKKVNNHKGSKRRYR